jgi:thiol-disulfide isomerase/thioredoxin
MTLPIITEIKSRDDYMNLIKSNPGLFIVKFGAEWCAPCKKIENEVLEKFNTMPKNVQCAIIDIDNNFDVYAFLKTKKMFAGIPAILCYQKENESYIPDEIHNNSNKDELRDFFTRCEELL